MVSMNEMAFPLSPKRRDRKSGQGTEELVELHGEGSMDQDIYGALRKVRSKAMWVSRQTWFDIFYRLSRGIQNFVPSSKVIIF